MYATPTAWPRATVLFNITHGLLNLILVVLIWIPPSTPAIEVKLPGKYSQKYYQEEVANDRGVVVALRQGPIGVGPGKEAKQGDAEEEAAYECAYPTRWLDSSLHHSPNIQTPQAASRIQ